MKTEKQISLAAAEFAERWKGRGYERGESQPFWMDLLSNVFGIETHSSMLKSVIPALLWWNFSNFAVQSL